VVESTLTDDAILSVTDNGGGNYDVVFTDTAAGEYAVLRVKALTSTVVDALSNTIYIEF
jgi:DNA gyrase inhibitor GyrI